MFDQACSVIAMGMGFPSAPTLAITSYCERAKPADDLVKQIASGYPWASARNFAAISGLRALTSARSFRQSSARSMGDRVLSSLRLMHSMRCSRCLSSSVTAILIVVCLSPVSDPYTRLAPARQGLQVKCQRVLTPCSRRRSAGQSCGGGITPRD